MTRFKQLDEGELNILYAEAEEARNHMSKVVSNADLVGTATKPKAAETSAAARRSPWTSGLGRQRRPPSDADLINAVRDGRAEEYGKLYERHVRSANILAMQLSSSSADADDLVADAFAKVLAALLAGGGPDASFRPYLLIAVRHAAYDRTRGRKRREPADGAEEVPRSTKATSVAPTNDSPVEKLDQALAATAFATLPERWQAVLWHTAIEGQSPEEIAPLLGLTANGVSAMAFRAREGLRKAFLMAHTNQRAAEDCRDTVTKLAAWTRGGLKGRDAIRIDEHMDTCAECRRLASELSDVNGALRSGVAEKVLGAAAAGYLIPEERN
jgi:RNA polymerase sigma factor (sigma-70 family)